MKKYEPIVPSFLKIVKKYPDHPAVITLHEYLTYSQINQLSHVLASEIQITNIPNNKIVGVVLEKGWRQIIAVLAIIKMGLAYVPIDYTETNERISYLLKSSEVELVITNTDKISVLKHRSNTILFIDIDKINPLSQKPSVEIVINQPDDLFYIIYTSGSSGKPKGVMITHKAATNTIEDINQRFAISLNDRIFAISNLIFDLSVYDMFGALVSGASIIMDTPNGVKDISAWDKLFFSKQVTIWNSVPALLEIFIEYLNHKYQILPFHSLRVVLLSGDWIPINLPDKIFKLFGKHVEVISLGGATEASIWSVMYPITHVDSAWKSIPYGKALTNQSVYILDENLELIKGNKIGEIFIGGQGVALGYYKNKEQTYKHFIHHSHYGRVYRTGDLGRYLSDGNIEFMGRVDFQTKISGYRVDLSAIEKQILFSPHVKQAVVVTVKEQLVAYVVLNEKYIMHKLENQDKQEKYVADWIKLYDLLFSKIKSTENNLLNTVGWVSSYTNEAISKIEMQEWVDNTIKQILKLSPRAVLEIGCGTGMLLLNLADKVTVYDATDVSKFAIDYVLGQLDKLNINNVNLIECDAKNIKSFNTRYDSIVLNSVVQYFPSVEYLVEVINSSINLLNNKGYIFIGDIRSLAHQKIFQSSILNYHNWLDSDFEQYDIILDHLKDNEQELLIDHRLFYYLQQLDSRITHVEVLIKEGVFHNEMNCFRYNVILHINKNLDEDVFTPELHDWSVEGYGLCLIQEMIASNEPCIAVKNVPNSRLTSLFKNKDKRMDVNNSSIVDPQSVFDLAYKNNYEPVLTWSDDEMCFNFVLNKTRKKINCSSLDKLPNNYELHNFANNPLIYQVNNNLIQQIKNHIKDVLPFYMIPTNFFILTKIPITRNGKVDRSSLLRMQSLFHVNKIYIPPRNDVEKHILNIWYKLIGTKKISVNQKFLLSGGTSFLTIKLMAEIKKEFKIELDLQKINFYDITVEYLAHLVDQRLKDT